MHDDVKKMPDLPGVYVFKKEGELLYVGKAKSLRKRVASYFRAHAQQEKVEALRKEYTHLEHIVTRSEIEAQLLEAQLIGAHKPKFNVLLRHGQAFLYILFTNDVLPVVELVRNKKKKGTYFGPFIHKHKARSAYRYVMDTFGLYLCNKKIQGGCLYYHMGKCAGQCKDTFSNEDYLFRLGLARQLLAGNYETSLNSLKMQLSQTTQELNFERARTIHRYIQNIETIFHTLKAKFSAEKYADESFIATAPVLPVNHSYPAIAQEITLLLALDKNPVLVDCFDISHMQGHYIVGSCIRFNQGVPDKNQFRRFKIKTLTNQNDYAALAEVVGRRYRDSANLPDLVVIDGGKGQLNAVKHLLPSTPVVSLAKREERLFSKAYPEGTLLDQKSDMGRFFIALRDYAHHFAISYHKKRRSKERSMA